MSIKLKKYTVKISLDLYTLSCYFWLRHFTMRGNNMKYGVFSANSFLYTDSICEKGEKIISISAPENSWCCVQILLECNDGFNINWHGDECLVPEINKLIPVYVDKNCGKGYETVASRGTPAEYSARQAPFNVYDAMEPVEKEAILPDENGLAAIYLRWNTGKISAGTHTGNIIITDSQGATAIPVTLKIVNVTVPKEGKLRVINWFNMGAMAKHHGVEPWSEEHWELIRTYGQLMRSCRQTDFMVSPHLAKKHITNDGNYEFDFTETKKFIQLYFSLGFTHIEGGMLTFRQNWDAAEFLVKPDKETVPALSEEGLKYIKSYYSQWYAFLRENDWTEITVQHVADEPHDRCAKDYCTLASVIRKCMPDVKLLDAVESTNLGDAIDIWIPKSIGYIADQENYDKHRGENTNFWYYTCCFPGGKYLNRLLDQELIRTRYLHWANYLYDFTGYLHWGFNFYDANGDNPFTGGCDKIDGHMGQILPAGDTHIVYPKGKKVLRSVRLEAMRAGVEDYELIMMLAEKDPVKAKEIVVKCVRSFTDYTTDINEFQAAYELLLSSLI